MTASNTNRHFVSARVLKVNVGFLLAEGPGFSRVITIDVPEPLRLADDTMLENLAGDLRLTRTSEGILVQGKLLCTTIEYCNRCLAETEVTYPLTIEELFATASHSSQFVVDEDNILDLAPLVREEALVSMPHQIYCRPDCQGLCPNCGQNLNEGSCNCHLEATDPRWAALAELQKKLSE